MTYTQYQAPSRRTSNKTAEGQQVYHMEGVLKKVFEVPVKQGADTMLVAVFQCTDRSGTQKGRTVKLAGKARDAFTSRNIATGEKVNFGGHFDGQFDLPDEKYGYIQVTTMFGHYVSRPDERNDGTEAKSATAGSTTGQGRPAFDQNLDDEIPF